ncbi:uncharacterized protein LOC106140306 [Amyelois transitella]|uniref:uncharacterized protein LOC106140306 n=1 Tax=Amyelois transitella TaxID=680683 RepID=UPI00067E5891|nr:uncharacterized protein LOC106140306 [Amyelois transitella]
MPVNDPGNVVEFSEVMSEIITIIENSEVESCIILGDFNAHPGTVFDNEVLNFCTDGNLIPADMQLLGRDSDTYTFVSDINGGRRWLDHCLVTESVLPLVSGVEVLTDVYWSDHFPLLVKCNLAMMKPMVHMSNKPCNKVVWGNRNEQQIRMYSNICNGKLKCIDFPSEFNSCCDTRCADLQHREVIDRFYDNIVSSLSQAAIESFLIKKGGRGGYIVGWNKHVKDAHREARLRFSEWVLHGKPSSGVFYNAMAESRILFKSKLKFCQNNQEQIQMDILASHHKSKKFGNFWKHTNKLNHRQGLPASIQGVVDPKQIANLFQERFRVQSPLQETQMMLGAGSVGSEAPFKVSSEDVSSIIENMTRGKSPGHDGLSIEHLLYAGVHLSRVLSMFFTFCIRHSYLPNELMKSIVVPIVKNKTGENSDICNYRPISLATVIAKVLDGVLERQLCKYVNVNEAQFGFRPGLSTENAILALKHTVRYYTDRRTPVYAAFLDLSMAFDTVIYSKLWSKLRDTTLPGDLIGVFEYWYSHQNNQVRWGDALSDPYTMECGVRQGGADLSHSL